MTSARTARALAIALVVATGVAIAIVAIARATRPRPDHVDPDRERYPIMGIDISAHNGVVDLARVAHTPYPAVAIDLEEWRNAPPASTGEIVVQLHGMVDYLLAAGHTPVIYTNKSGHQRFVRGRFDNLPLWICSFTDPPISRADWTLWQHSHVGRVDGVPGPVDLNTFCGDSAAFHRWLAQPPH